jgi:hypothetical protein
MEITFAFKPAIFSVRPTRKYEETVSPMGQFTLSFSSLAPREFLVVDLVAINNELPLLTVVRSEESAGEMVPMEPQRVYPAWYTRILLALMFIGFASVIYGIVTLVLQVPGRAPAKPAAVIQKTK